MDRRTLLLTCPSLLLAAALSAPALAAPAANPDALLGAWTVSAVDEPEPKGDRATLAKATSGELVLDVRGELAKALGGPVHLKPLSATEWAGTSPSGERVSVRVASSRRLELALQGPKTLFTMFLLR